MTSTTSAAPAADTTLSYTAHSAFTDPGELRDWLQDAPRTVAGIRRLATTLVFHYRASGDPTTLGFERERLSEIDLRYAERILGRARELQGGSITEPRRALCRVLGCCRDFTLLFVTLAREAGIPSRMRVGFGGYLIDGWWIDHVIAEVWDAQVGSWSLVEPQMPEGFLDATTGEPLDLEHLSRDRFLVGADAWLAARAGAIDPARCVVDPSIELSVTRSWPYLVHHLAADLAAVNGHELLLWDVWGALEQFIDADGAATLENASIDRPGEQPTDEQFTALDELARALAAATDPRSGPCESAAGAADAYASSDFVVGDGVLTLSPFGAPPRRTFLRGGV